MKTDSEIFSNIAIGGDNGCSNEGAHGRMECNQEKIYRFLFTKDESSDITFSSINLKIRKKAPSKLTSCTGQRLPCLGSGRVR